MASAAPPRPRASPARLPVARERERASESTSRTPRRWGLDRPRRHDRRPARPPLAHAAGAPAASHGRARGPAVPRVRDAQGGLAMWHTGHGGPTLTLGRRPETDLAIGCDDEAPS